MLSLPQAGGASERRWEEGCLEEGVSEGWDGTVGVDSGTLPPPWDQEAEHSHGRSWWGRGSSCVGTRRLLLGPRLCCAFQVPNYP